MGRLEFVEAQRSTRRMIAAFSVEAHDWNPRAAQYGAVRSMRWDSKRIDANSIASNRWERRCSPKNFLAPEWRAQSIAEPMPNVPTAEKSIRDNTATLRGNRRVTGRARLAVSASPH
jgi:hypothetical protein